MNIEIHRLLLAEWGIAAHEANFSGFVDCS